jgi:hypothetical protein
MKLPPEESKILRIAPRTPRACTNDVAVVGVRGVGEVKGEGVKGVSPKAESPNPTRDVPEAHRHSHRRVTLALIAVFALIAAAALILSDRRKS